jgi:hypothetical protein
VLALALRVGNGVETDMFAMAGDSFGPDIQAAAAASADRARVLLEGTGREEVIRAAHMVRALVGGERSGTDLLRDLRGCTDGLLSPQDRALISSNATAAVREAAEARLFSLAPPLFSVKDDPMLLASSFLESLDGFLAPGWSIHDGMPVMFEEGRASALVALSLKGRSPREVVEIMERIPGELPSGVTARFSGAAFHAALSARRVEREIGFLSGASLVLVLVLGWMLFRSLSFVAPLVVALASGGIAAAGALFAAWPRPHAIAFVFGTSLIGLSVDYVYHARAAGGARSVLRPLTQSFATTMACFAPLLFADLPVLRQMALFTMAGLAAVYAGVAVFGWRGGDTVPVRHEESSAPIFRSIPQFNILRVVLFIVTAFGIVHLRPTADPSAFYRPNASLAADERAVAERLSLGGARIVFARGDTLQEALEHEEDAGVPFGLSRIIPSLKRQRENAALVERLYAAEGAAYAEHTGLKHPVVPDEPRLLDPEKLPQGSSLGELVATMWTGRGLMSPCVGDFSPKDPRVQVIDMRESTESAFARAFRSTRRLFVYSSAALLVFLFAVFRRRALSFACPVAAALVSTLGMLGWLGVPFTFFTLLSFFILLGLGLDYTIFHRGADAPTAGRTVLFAFLTSLAGLGLLSFTAFPVTRDMGITFAFGLFFAYVFSMRVVKAG